MQSCNVSKTTFMCKENVKLKCFHLLALKCFELFEKCFKHNELNVFFFFLQGPETLGSVNFSFEVLQKYYIYIHNMLCKVGKSLKNRNMQNTNISLTVHLKNRRFYNLAIFILLKKKILKITNSV